MQAYKASEKRFKKLSDTQIREDTAVLNVHALTSTQQTLVTQIGTWKWTDPIDSTERERPVLAFSAMGEIHEGFYVIPNAIDAMTQLEIAYASLTEYVEPPHVTNMRQQHGEITQLWKKARQTHPHDPSKAPTLNKLHWAATGYHYDWTARKYYLNDVSPVPELLASLGQRVATACGTTLTSEAVIVNFYHKNSTMGGHQDDVENTMDHPVVSLSLGCDCVFLKGSCTKDDAPLEVLLRSGDIAILSGKSRLSFHGVAKILPTTFAIAEDEMKALVDQMTQKETSTTPDEWKEDLKAVQKYMETHRININIRQVYGEQPPTGDKKASPTTTETQDTQKTTVEPQHTPKRQKL